MEDIIDLTKYKNKHSRKHKVQRLLWLVVWNILIRPLPTCKFTMPWVRFWLRLFGAKLSYNAGVYTSVRIYHPKNLIMDENTCLSEYVDCYDVDIIHICSNVTVSKRSFLCTASHDIYSKGHELITAPIIIESQAWIAADAFIGKGVTVGEGCVVAARACVVKDTKAWTVVGGNPAKEIGVRVIKN